MAEKLDGMVMADGLIHTKNGGIFFQDGTAVKGVNMELSWDFYG